jgi:hypothetical protein
MGSRLIADRSIREERRLGQVEVALLQVLKGKLKPRLPHQVSVDQPLCGQPPLQRPNAEAEVRRHVVDRRLSVAEAPRDLKTQSSGSGNGRTSGDPRSAASLSKEADRGS